MKEMNWYLLKRTMDEIDATIGTIESELASLKAQRNRIDMILDSEEIEQ